jgi:uncharacterized phage protein gp47/JayE
MHEDRTEENIKKEMLDNISDEIDKTENKFINNAITPAAIKFAETYIGLDYIASKLDVENLEGEELERYVYQHTGTVIRKPATKATTVVTISGQEGASIKVGNLVAADTVNFISTEDKTVGPNGQIEVLVECESPGTIGNVPAGAIKYFPVSIPGLTSVTNTEPITNGYNAESDENLLERYYERIRTPATSGNKYHYLNWAKEVTGVGDVRVVPLWNGNNTVKAIIIDSNKQPASTELVEQVQEYIDPNITGLGEGQAPIGAFCTVVSATGKAIDITFTVTRDTNYTVEQIKANVENNIKEYLQSIAFKEDIVSYAKIGALILDSEGVLDYQGLTINSGTSNIAITNEEVAILGTVTINE